MSSNYVFVSESVTRGHPDKLCDQISDALVDEYLRDDPCARVDAECAVSNGIVFIGAHYLADTPVDVAGTVRSVIAAAGYTEGEFNDQDCTILTSLNEITSLPRLPALDEMPGDELLDEHVARHQGTVFGYACKQTADFMPLPIQLAHRLARQLDDVRVAGMLDYLLPDAKTQVAVEYADRTPRRIHTVSLTASAEPARVPNHRAFVDDLTEAVIVPVCKERSPGLDKQTRLLVNNDGVIRAGGPALHSGLTGRKTAVDTYGEFARHSGAALSGKDPLRIDRLGAYAARHAAKNVVAAGLAEECEVQLSYTIGFARPVSLHVETFGTGRIEAGKIAERVRRNFEFRPLGMMLGYALDTPADGEGAYRRLAVYGHVGRSDLDLPWERLDKVDALA